MREIHSMDIVVRAVFYENNKYCPEAFWDECLYELKIINMMYDERTDLSERTNINKTSAWRECYGPHYLYLFNYSLKLL